MTNGQRARGKSVTIVVPAYGDVESLSECIQSLKRSVDLDRHQVLIVNDCGPDADLIEEAVRRQTSDAKGFRYERNPENLGFVGNCNRAVFELDKGPNDVLLLNSDTVVTEGFLDEMLDVLYAAPSHGVVCARSNNATIASLPFRQVFAGPRSQQRTRRVFDELAPELPKYNISPVAMGFCFLVRRDLIDKFGLFDEIFSPGYGEENDFCLRVNESGYLSLIANRALVFHGVAASFTDARRNVLRREHGLILSARYPHYDSSVQHYLAHSIDPVEHFADALVPRGGPCRIVVDAGNQDPAASAAASFLLDDLRALSRERAHIFLVVAEQNYTRAAMRFRGVTVVPTGQIDGIFDLALSVEPSPDRAQFMRMSRLSCRWVFLDLDIDRQNVWSDRMVDPLNTAIAMACLHLADAVIHSAPEANRHEGPSEIAHSIAEGDHALERVSLGESTSGTLIELSQSRPSSFEKLRERSSISGWLSVSDVPSRPALPRPEGLPSKLYRLARRVRNQFRRL